MKKLNVSAPKFGVIYQPCDEDKNAAIVKLSEDGNSYEIVFSGVVFTDFGKLILMVRDGYIAPYYIGDDVDTPQAYFQFEIRCHLENLVSGVIFQIDFTKNDYHFISTEGVYEHLGKRIRMNDYDEYCFDTGKEIAYVKRQGGSELAEWIEKVPYDSYKIRKTLFLRETVVEVVKDGKKQKIVLPNL